ncbi:conserved hypothetical protein [Candidatus Propionivibrio aalborgensis]|uniref:Uncharacterized protein n=1 Tax=Candidatus Propionivibrio aalborgensis TaxID=1860101 RepID=A0A1A8XUV1_9RHOO|nr:hypothetical protein [Candidatus Propionivibrio aalborgensis]SBT08347.1 conserved hypothetical protein [Candidatus Propionivibrio aalborgensis]
MDVAYFFNRRLEFIRQLYDTASSPYLERKRKIEAEEVPFALPYSEDGEPAFLEEWIEADESLHVLAYSCVSMLAGALHLYLETWVSESHVRIDEALKKTFKKIGWFPGYKTHYFQRFAINFEACQENLRLLEEVVLARNRIEHPSSITSIRINYDDANLRKLPHPFFIDEREAALFADAEEDERAWFIPPTLHVTEKQLLAAITVAEGFAKWFDAEIESRIYAQ